jgi:hypothetical protein
LQTFNSQPEVEKSSFKIELGFKRLKSLPDGEVQKEIPSKEDDANITIHLGAKVFGMLQR